MTTPKLPPDTAEALRKIADQLRGCAEALCDDDLHGWAGTLDTLAKIIIEDENLAPAQELPPVRPKRPRYTAHDIGTWNVEMRDWRVAVEEYDHAAMLAAIEEDARALKAGQAVYGKMLEAEAETAENNEASGPALTLRGEVHITMADFRDWQTWCKTYGGPTFELPLSFEFAMFSGAVLVVVR